MILFNTPLRGTPRRQYFFSGRNLLFVALAVLAVPVAAQPYPSKPIRIVSQYAAGATADTLTRVVAGILQDGFSQAIVVEDRPQNEGVAAAEMVARSAPDGYTLLVAGASTQVVRARLVRNGSFDPVKDFTPLAVLGESPAIIVAHPSVTARDFKALLAYAKAHPGKVTYGSPRPGSPNHVTGEQIAMLTGARMAHVPYGGQAERQRAQAWGQVDTSYMVLVPAQQMIGAGKARALIVISDKRIQEMPDVPAITEVIPGFSPIRAWVGLFGPAGLPDPVARRVNNEVRKGMNAPTHRAKIESAGYRLIAGSPEDFAALIARDLEIVGRVVKATNMQPAE
jgi:tripartite-type tricarboxylate transporter receptor subunit TctC